jgi:hypothetical protein
LVAVEEEVMRVLIIQRATTLVCLEGLAEEQRQHVLDLLQQVRVHLVKEIQEVLLAGALTDTGLVEAELAV